MIKKYKLVVCLLFIVFTFFRSAVFSMPAYPDSPSGENRIVLGKEHIKAVNRQRRLIIQYDTKHSLQTELGEWTKKIFEPIDLTPANQIDAIWLDVEWGNVAPYPERVGDSFELPELRKWWDEGKDWMAVQIKEVKDRKKEVFWNHRIAEYDIQNNVLKQSNPEWIIKSWHYQGLWDLSNKAVRDYKVKYLREVLEKYQLDGIQLDFARHIPCLPVGQQWELREHVTEFVRQVRVMTLEMSNGKRPILLSVKVPQNERGCRVDGFDVEKWAEESLVDIFTIGSRSIEVDIDYFKRIAKGRNIKIYPCWDTHHSSDAYKHAPIEVLRGIFTNWWAQGADGITIFNWFCDNFSDRYLPTYRNTLLAIVSEAGNPILLNKGKKSFVLERRGGYPYAEGYFGKNLDALLPKEISNSGRQEELLLRVDENLSDKSTVSLDLILYGAAAEDELFVSLNDHILSMPVLDSGHKDPQIFAPSISTEGINLYVQTKALVAIPNDKVLEMDPKQSLVKMSFPVNPAYCRKGSNVVHIGVKKRGVYKNGYNSNLIQLEKLELVLK